MQKPFRFGRINGQYPYEAGDVLCCVTPASQGFTMGADYRVCRIGRELGLEGNNGAEVVTSFATFINLSAQEASMPDVSILGDMVKVVTSTTLVSKIDGRLPNHADFTVEVVSRQSIKLVVGARYKDRVSCAFSKGHVKELIDRLEAIHSLMED